MDGLFLIFVSENMEERELLPFLFKSGTTTQLKTVFQDVIMELVINCQMDSKPVTVTKWMKPGLHSSVNPASTILTGLSYMGGNPYMPPRFPAPFASRQSSFSAYIGVMGLGYIHFNQVLMS